MPTGNSSYGFDLERGEIASIRFNAPKGVNIFSTIVLKSFREALRELKSSGEARALVITGSGNTFMAGGDIKEMSSFGPKEAEAFSTLFHRAMAEIEDFPCPVVAAVNGFALGGGMELVLACDIAVASDIAMFGSPEVSLGVIPGAGGTRRLTERVGKPRAKELVFTARRFSAHEALSWGVINRVVPKDALMEEVMDMARNIASRPVHCIRALKLLVNAPSHEDEIKLFASMFAFDDQKALMTKFLEKG